MDGQKLQRLMRAVMVLIGCILFFIIFISMLNLEVAKKPLEERNRILASQENFIKIYDTLPKPWPPEMNQPYPDYTLIDQEGQKFKLSDLRGKVIVVETVDMTSAVSQGYSGAATLGAFGAQTQEVDKTVSTTQDYLTKYSEGKITLPNPEIVIVKIIYYNSAAEQPTPVDATNWAQHFQFTKAGNIIVAVPENDMRSHVTSMITPGFQLIDRNFNLRVDAGGANPKHSMTMTLVPLIPKLL